MRLDRETKMAGMMTRETGPRASSLVREVIQKQKARFRLTHAVFSWTQGKKKWLKISKTRRERRKDGEERIENKEWEKANLKRGREMRWGYTRWADATTVWQVSNDVCKGRGVPVVCHPLPHFASLRCRAAAAVAYPGRRFDAVRTRCPEIASSAEATIRVEVRNSNKTGTHTPQLDKVEFRERATLWHHAHPCTYLHRLTQLKGVGGAAIERATDGLVVRHLCSRELNREAFLLDLSFLSLCLGTNIPFVSMYSTPVVCASSARQTLNALEATKRDRQIACVPHAPRMLTILYGPGVPIPSFVWTTAARTLCIPCAGARASRVALDSPYRAICACNSVYAFLSHI